MNFIATTPTSRGGGSLIFPSWGTMHVALDGDYVMALAADGVTLETLERAFAGGPTSPLHECEVWFEDARERTSH